MTTFLNAEGDDSSSSDENQIEFDFINIPDKLDIKDREDDNFEIEEVPEPPEPFNLEELNVSVPRIKYDVDEFYLEMLREKY